MFAEIALIATTATTVVTSFHAARLSRRVYSDELTGLANRAALHRAARRICRHRRRGLIGLLLIDLDRFKQINDTHGHHIGNAVLVAVANRLTTAARPGELVARLHGDEFAVLLPRLDQPSDAERRAREIATLLAEPLLISDLRLVATGSVGAAADTASTTTIATLLRHADQRMYHAKRHGRLSTLPTTPRLRLRDHNGKDAA